MQSRTKKILFWSFLLLVFIFGICSNMLIENGMPPNRAIDQIYKAPLAVKAYVLLLGMMTFLSGEILLYSYRYRDVNYPMVMVLALIIAFAYHRFYYFMILAIVIIFFEMAILWQTRHRIDAINEVINQVLDEYGLEPKAEVLQTQELPEVNEAPSKIVFEDVPFEQEQQEEIEQFLESLFFDTMVQVEDEKMAEEILEDANEIFDELDEETKITDSNETVSDETVFEIGMESEEELLDDLVEETKPEV